MKRALLLVLSASLACAPQRRNLAPDPAARDRDFAGRPLDGNVAPFRSDDASAPERPVQEEREIALFVGVGVVAAVIIGLVAGCSCSPGTQCTFCQSVPGSSPR